MYRTKKLALTSLGHFINDGTGVLAFLVVDVMASKFSLPPWIVAALFIVYYVASSVLSTYVGKVADRTGLPGQMIAVGLALMSTGLVLLLVILRIRIPLIDVVAAGALAVGLMGFGSTFYHPLGAVILQSGYGGKVRGKALGLNGAAGSIGRAIYPYLFLLAAVSVTIGGSIAAFSLIGFAACMAIWYGFHSDKGVSPKSGSGSAEQQGVLTRGVILLVIVSFIRSVAFQTVTSWISLYLTFTRGLGISLKLGTDLTGMYALAIVGQPLFGVLVDRFDKRYILAISSAGAGLSIFYYIGLTGPLSVVALSLFGLFAFSGFPLLFSITSDYVPKASSAFGNALVWGIGGTGGSMVGQILTLVISENSYAGLASSFRVMALLAVLAAVVTLTIPAKRQRPDEQYESNPKAAPPNPRGD